MTERSFKQIKAQMAGPIARLEAMAEKRFSWVLAEMEKLAERYGDGACGECGPDSQAQLMGPQGSEFRKYFYCSMCGRRLHPFVEKSGSLRWRPAINDLPAISEPDPLEQQVDKSRNPAVSEQVEFNYDPQSGRSKFNQFIDACPDWVQAEVWGANGMRAEIEKREKEIKKLSIQVADVTWVSHSGGDCGMSEMEALKQIRMLTRDTYAKELYLFAPGPDRALRVHRATVRAYKDSQPKPPLTGVATND